MVGKVVVGDEEDVGGPLAVIEVIFGVGFPNGDAAARQKDESNVFLCDRMHEMRWAITDAEVITEDED